MSTQPTPLTPEQLADMRQRLAQTRDLAALSDWPLEDYHAVRQQFADMAALLAEAERLRLALRSACDHIAVLDGAIAAQTARANAAEASRVAVLLEARDAVVSWLTKKAAEERARGSRYRARADLIGVLASKVSRGAIRLLPNTAEWGVQYPDDRGGPVLRFTDRTHAEHQLAGARSAGYDDAVLVRREFGGHWRPVAEDGGETR